MARTPVRPARPSRSKKSGSSPRQPRKATPVAKKPSQRSPKAAHPAKKTPRGSTAVKPVRKPAQKVQPAKSAKAPAKAPVKKKTSAAETASRPTARKPPAAKKPQMEAPASEIKIAPVLSDSPAPKVRGKSKPGPKSIDPGELPRLNGGSAIPVEAGEEDLGEAWTPDGDGLFEPELPRSRSKGGRSTSARESGDDFIDEFEDDLPLDEDEIIPEAIELDPLDVPIELLDPDLIEVPRPAPASKPRPARGERRTQACDGCGGLYSWLSVERLCFNCLKKKLAAKKREDEGYGTGFGGTSSASSEADEDDGE